MRTGPRGTIFSALAVTDSRLTPAAVRVLARMGIENDQQGWHSIKHEEYAKSVGLKSREGVTRALKLLASCGYIEVRERGKQLASGRTVHEYRTTCNLTDEQVAKANAARFPCAPEITCDPGSCADPITRDPQVTRESDPTITCDPACTGATIPSKEDSLGDNKQQKQVVVGDVVDPRALDRIFEVAGPGLSDRSKEPQLLLTAHLIAHWLGAGADFELDVLPVIAALSSQPRDPPIKSFRFFSSAIRKHAAERMADVAPITPAESKPNGTRSRSSKYDVREEFDRVAAEHNARRGASDGVR